MLTKKDVARILTISRPHLDKEISSGRLPVVRVGRRVLITPEDLDQYIERHRQVGRQQR